MEKTAEHFPTLFEDEIDETFLKSIKKHPLPVTSKAIVSDVFTIATSVNNPTFFNYIFELQDHYIVCKKTDTKKETAFMNIMHAFVKIIETTINNKKFFGIKFIKKKSFEELLSQDENVILKWYNAVKPYCIMMKFRLYFDTKKVLGSGNYAKVLLVERQSDRQQFAVKVFSKKDFMKEELEKRSIKYEIKMLRSTCHPRVMRMYELYEGETFVYCLCDLFEGIDLLNAIIKKGPQSELKALSIVFQILESLAYLHSMGIMHRDIKPENIIFKSTNDSIDIGIVDLGFATYEADYKKLFLRCGTPGYVAPEILNDKEYNCKVDIYSAGIIFYIMQVNKIDRTHAIYRKHLR